MLIGLLGCGQRPATTVQAQSTPPGVLQQERLVFADDMDRDSLRQALQQSLSYIQRQPPQRLFPLGERQVSAALLVQTLQAFQHIIDTAQTTEALQQALHEQFEVVQSVGRNGLGEVLFTGYYEITLEGSPVQRPDFPYPLYTRPPDLQEVDSSTLTSRAPGERIQVRYERGRAVPYFTRQEIDAEGRLRGRGLELLWLRNPVDGFFLHVQGSGQIRFPTGEVRRVNYAASNGHPYTSLGKILLDEGKIPRHAMSLQGLRQYFRTYPEDTARLLQRNLRYIFFRQAEQPPVGNLGFVLVPGRSIATDQRVFPAGGLALVQMQQPLLNAQGAITGWYPVSRFVLNHDTGSAIVGPGRVDLFWGSGARAEMGAGHMQHPGQMFFLVKRQAS